MVKDRRITIPIAGIIEETPDVRTFRFDFNPGAAAGQFVMLTDFNGGEKPFSISACDDSGLSVTIKKVGNFTARLFSLHEGDIISIRGPYGSSFFIPGEDRSEAGSAAAGDNADLSRQSAARAGIEPKNFRPVLAGGGFGLPPLYLLAVKLIESGAAPSNIRVISAGRTAADILFRERFEALGVIFTGVAEDACGASDVFEGTAAAALESMKGEYNFVYSSGPDLMMKSLIQVFGPETDYDFLFERYMKCAIGICGSCVMDPSGIRVCKEGPALSRALVEQLEDFGVYKRTASGSVEKFKNRFAGESV